MRHRGWRVGTDPVGRITKVENHDAAYHAWLDAGVRRRILIHIDAHHDMWWVSDPGEITIANFISPALAEDIVREVFWVVPDRTWDGKRGLRPVLRHLRQVTERYPGARSAIQIEKNRISAVVLGKKLTVCPLALLPQIDEDVLLDIDVDFLVIPRVSYGVPDEHGVLPWCWPGELVARLRAAAVRTDLVTIAYSVEGGYTPLRWKYLGDELMERLAELGGGTPTIRGMDLMREAALATERGDLTGAERKYHEVTTSLPDCAAPYCHLAYLLVERGRTGEAQKLYRHALALDPSYRTPYSGTGFTLYWDGRFAEAEKEYRRLLTLDPQDPFTLLGLALVAAQRRRWDEAAGLLHTALALDERLVDGYRALGHVLTHQGRRREAIAAYERSLQLTLAGHKPIERPIATDVQNGRVVDPDHCLVHACLAQLYASLGATTRAISGYQISIAGGHDGLGLRGRLAWLYLKQGDWRTALAQLWRLLLVSPGQLQQAGHRFYRRLQRAVDGRGRYRLARAFSSSAAR